MMSSIDQRFMSDLEEGPENIFQVRQPTWRSPELENLLARLDRRAADKIAQAVATFEIDHTGPMPTIAPRKERQRGPPSDRQPPRRLAPSKKWACKMSTPSSTTEH